MGERCTCTVAVPRREAAVWRDPFNGYAIRVDEWHDDAAFDPACPFHGDNGSMVERVPISDASAT